MAGFNDNFDVECDTSSSSITEYNTYNLLPTGGSAPAHGTKGIVTTTRAAGTYVYFSAVDGYAVDVWIPYKEAQLGLSYLLDASSNPARISAGWGGDTASTIASRGWPVTSVGAGSGVSDSGGGDITWTSGANSPNYVYSQFTLNTASSAKNIFVILNMDGSYQAGTTYSYQGGFQMSDGVKIKQLSASAGAANTWAWFNSSGTPVRVGDGEFVTPSFGTVMCRLSWQPSSDDGGSVIAWEANVGSGAGGENSSALQKDFPSNAGKLIYIQCDTDSGVGSSFDVREFHAFEVG